MFSPHPLSNRSDQRSHRRIGKPIAVAIASAVVVFSQVPPAKAALLTNLGLDQFINSLEQSWQQKRLELEAATFEMLQGLGFADLNVHDLLGPMNLPNPQAIAEVLLTTTVPEVQPPIHDAHGRAQEHIRTTQRTLATAVHTAELSAAGQMQTQQHLQTTVERVARIQGYGEQAVQATSTQEVMKSHALQQAEMGALLADLQVAALRDRSDAALQGLHLSNISEALDQQAIAKRVEAEANAFNLLVTGFQMRLD